MKKAIVLGLVALLVIGFTVATYGRAQANEANNPTTEESPKPDAPPVWDLPWIPGETPEPEAPPVLE